MIIVENLNGMFATAVIRGNVYNQSMTLRKE